ncbi:hypothetical protein diail_1845 [Diaporthe ilicicola]|nr:hypothetical protein diail_1845 [Diaporthe ilicicola]
MLLLSTLIVPSHASTGCDATAISIPPQDTKVLDDVEDSYMIGLRTKLGTPSQDILMLPWPELNNTWVYDYQPYCDDTIIRNDLICRVRRSDYFFENASSKYSRATTMQAAGGATQETTYSGSETGIPSLITSSINGDDVIELGSTNLTSFPIGIPRLNWDHGYTTIHALGLGKNSTFLNSLLQAGQIASLSWSLFWGRMWVDDWLDGSLVLGGYDSKLSVGENYTQSLDYSDDDGTGCWTGMKVTVTGIELNFSNGSNLNIYEDALPV